MLPLTQHKMQEAEVWRIDRRNLQGCFSALSLPPCPAWSGCPRGALTPTPPPPQLQYPLCLSLLSSGRVNVKPLITHRCGGPAAGTAGTAGLLHAWAEPRPSAHWPSTGRLQRHPFPSFHTAPLPALLSTWGVSDLTLTQCILLPSAGLGSAPRMCSTALRRHTWRTRLAPSK